MKMLRKVLLQPCVSYCRLYARRLIQRSTVKRLEYLYLGLKNTEITKENLRELSEDIVSVSMKPREDKSYAFVGFKNIELADENLRKFKEMGLNVRYSGLKQKSIAENDRKKLHLVFTDPDITEEHVHSLSADIVNIECIRKPNYCSAYLTFPSVPCARETYFTFQEQGLDVNFVGDDKKKFKAHLSLYLIFPNSIIRREDVWNISEDIVDVDLKWESNSISYAFVLFPTEEIAEKTYALMKNLGFKVLHCGRKSSLISELDSNSLLLRFPLDHDKITKEYVKSLSDDIQDVSISPWETGSLAVVRFASKELAKSNHEAFAEKETVVSYMEEQPAPMDKSKVLWVALPYPGMTVDKVKKLSDDIVNARLFCRGKELSFAFIEFASNDLREKNFATLHNQGLKVFFVKDSASVWAVSIADQLKSLRDREDNKIIDW